MMDHYLIEAHEELLRDFGFMLKIIVIYIQALLYVCWSLVTLLICVFKSPSLFGRVRSLKWVPPQILASKPPNSLGGNPTRKSGCSTLNPSGSGGRGLTLFEVLEEIGRESGQIRYFLNSPKPKYYVPGDFRTLDLPVSASSSPA